jgi:cell division septation protein DedD
LAQDDYYYEIQLTNKQLVFYFMAGATGLILSFLAGVMVGRGVDAQAGEVQAARGQEERTIVEETPRPVSPPPSPSELSYAQRLESEKPDDSLAKALPAAAATKGSSSKPPLAAPTAAPTAPPPAPREVKVAPTPRATPEPAVAETRPSPTPASARLAAREPKEGREPRASKGGAFAIQVGAFKDRGTADTVVSRLKGKGFAAFVVPPDGSDGLFLVRVGSFAARADAERTEAKLRDQEKFKPYIVKN